MTEPTTPDDEAMERAQKRVKAVKDFWSFLGIYLLVNAIVITVNLLTSSDALWFYWVSLGMGIPLVITAVNALMASWGRASTWEERKLRQYYEQERRRSSP
ncbi:MAG: 2TM domain-containing protein [Acidimicrobiia bacterium]|nr:2TM domain-containing protein [Acidimicrobiia bacterium]